MILDPLAITPAQITGTISKRELPSLTKAQLDFGFVPNIRNINPGDAILTQSVRNEGKFEEEIREKQKKQFDERNDWTHAAIYAQEWRAVEATPENDVAVVEILSWVPDSKLLIRRPVSFSTMTPTDAKFYGLSMALEAAMLQGRSTYGKQTALEMAYRLYENTRNLPKRIFSRQSETDPRWIVCSGLYVKCHDIVLARPLLSLEMIRRNEPMTPALLANVISLEDVQVGWAKLV